MQGYEKKGYQVLWLVPYQISSEAFTILGGTTSTAGGTTTTFTVPEPSSIMLLGSDVLGLAGVLRRKLF